MRLSRRHAAVEMLEARRLFSGGTGHTVLAHPPVASASLVSIASVGASMDFLTDSQTVSNASGSVEVVVVRGGDTSGNVAVNYSTADGSAAAGTDYTTKTGSLTFGPGETEKSFFVGLADRPAAPAAQDFTVTLSSPSPGAFLGTTTTQTITLQNDRAPVTLAASSYSKSTDDTGVDVVVTRGGNTTIPVTVAYATSNGSASAGVDYTATDGTLTFGAGETSKTITLPLLNNLDAADGVDFGFALSDPAGGAVLIGTSSTTVTIHNGYAPVNLDASSYTVTTDDAYVTVNVVRTGNTAVPASVHYATADGTATNGNDYLATSGLVSFAAGETSKQFTVALAGNVEAAGDLGFTVSLSSPGGAAVLGAVTSSPVTIENPYSPLRVTASAVDIATDDAAVAVTVVRTGNTSVAAAVDYATSDLTAQAGTDYVATSGTLTFAPGEVSKDIVVALKHNVDAENLLYFDVALSNGTGGAVIDSPAESIVAIHNLHVPLQLDAASYTVSTEDSAATLTVKRTGNIAAAVSVHYATSDASAADGVDYTAAAGTLNFAAGETEETITVPLLHNFAASDGLVFNVNLSSPGGGAELGATDSAPVTIENLHSVIQLAAASYPVDVRDGAVTLTVVRTGNTSLGASVDYATVDGTAVDGEDYFGAFGTLGFDPGQTSQTIQVSVLGDAASPASRGFDVNLSSADGNGVLGARTTSSVDIRNNQSLVQFTSASYTVLADAGTATLTLTRVGNTTVPLAVDYATSDGTAQSGRDYAARSGTVNFVAGQTSKTVSVPVLVNPTGGASVAFNVDLVNAVGGVIGATAVSEVTVDNLHSVASVDAATMTVSNDDGTVAVTVHRTGNTSLAGTVDYTTFAGTAVAGADYTAASGVLSFAAGETEQQITITLPGNPLADSTRVFGVTISGGTGGSSVGAADTTRITVTNNHSVVTFDAPTVTVSNDDGVAVVTVHRAGNTSLAGSVDYTTFSDTAVAGTDYTAAEGVLSFAAGETEKQVTINLSGNPLADPTRVFGVTLSGGTGGAAAGAAATTRVTVINLHSVISLDAAAVASSESAGVVTVTLSRVGNTDLPATVDYATADGTATAGADYAAAAGTVSFPAGQSTASFDVPVNSDLVFDPDETFSVSLGNAAGGAVLGGATSAVVTLADTTPAPTFSGGGLTSARPGKLDGVSLSFDQALEAPPVSAFSLFQRTGDQPGGAAKLKPVAIGSLSYDAEMHAVTVKPTKALKPGSFYQLVVDSAQIHGAGGRSLDGAGTGEGSALVLTFAQGRRLKYVDQDGDTVQLSLKGPGMMELVRRADEEGERLTLSATTAATRLVGTVRPGRVGGDGHTSLDTIVGLGAATSLLSVDQFIVREIL